jgi:hypothetical protein
MPSQVPPDKLYAELCADFRALNTFFWQIPLIMMTLNGGLWFAVAGMEISDALRQAVLIFAAVADLLMIIALWRLRFNMNELLVQIHQLEGRQVSKGFGLIAVLFSLLLLMAAVGAGLAASSPQTYFLRAPVATGA